ncbi:dihydroorotate dehydrogenase-like protein [Paramagnetospirillum magneticum]|uniref:Dihydroorotate dehydrogenase n=1 Tax=Paramagnetospirillum magneticum (strain ATCC 700264 / AMB-1) TaxID=342108 RepID=Q2W4R2_PARM1|nr:dihydroorotate dehydrogenase-like protein [Paramagnetospirillum magneticum]BAE51163.1 Dihydroorotate dehydrogenase [Paramagnetospirillum magneticum AMB-1]
MNLATRYLGLDIKNPLVVSASPLALDLGNSRRLEDCGAAAIVLPSIFQEDIENEIDEIERLVCEGNSEAFSYFPANISANAGPKNYLDLIRRTREALEIPVIASLNGTTRTGWTEYAAQSQQAGASAIELNVYLLPTDMDMSGTEVESRYLEILEDVKSAVSIPVSMKLSPYFSSVGNMVKVLDDHGVDGVVLFNRFYQPDIDLDELKLVRDLKLSHKGEIRLPLLWIATLAGKIKASIAASSGVQTAAEVVKYLFVGADVVMTTSALMRHGVDYMKTLHDGLIAELKEREAESVADIRGKMSRGATRDLAAYDRVNYIRILRGGAYNA